MRGRAHGMTVTASATMVAAIVAAVVVVATPSFAQVFFPPPGGNPDAQVDGATVTLTWPPPSDPAPRGWNHIGYRVYRDGKLRDQGSTTSFSEKSVPPGTYLYTVTAVYRENIATRPPEEAESSAVRKQVTVDPPPKDPPPEDPPPKDPPPKDPPPGGSTPPPGGSTPPPGGSTPPPGGSTPPSGGSTPPSGGSTPPPGGSTPPPGGSTPPPETEEEPEPVDEVEEVPEEEVAEDEVLPEVLAAPAEDLPEPGPLVLDALTVSPGAAVLVRGDGCRPGEDVVVSTTVATTTGVAEDDGGFTVHATAPPHAGRSEVEVACGDMLRSIPVAVVTTTMSGTGSSVVATLLLFFVLLATALWPRRSTSGDRAG